MSLLGAGMVITVLFAYLTLQAMWVLIGPSWSFTSLCCLAFAVRFPGMVYYYALFSVSLLAFLAILLLLLFIRRHYLSSGVVGALCCWAFAIGPLIGVVLSWRPCSSTGPWLLAHRRESTGVTFRRVRRVAAHQ